MNEKPILFSGEMVRAILSGRKTETRRIVRLPPGYEHGEVYGYGGCHGGLHALACDPGPSRAIRCPYGAPGDRLWVRETWGVACRPDPYEGWVDGLEYRADEIGMDDLDPLPLHPANNPPDTDLDSFSRGGWRPSIHMPRWASRLTLDVVSVRVERLQDITEDGARREGVDRGAPWFPPGQWAPPDEDPNLVGYGRGNFALQNFRVLWDHINGKRATWDSNPWVWVVSFKVEVPHA